MKQILLISLAVVVISGCAGSGRGLMHRAAEVDRVLVGTWEYVHADPATYRQIKILNATHFVWVTHERSTGMAIALGGGTYEFDGNTYVERLEFGSEGLPLELLGHDQVFRAEIVGDLWYHEGTLSNGFEVREIWRRLDQPSNAISTYTDTNIYMKPAESSIRSRGLVDNPG
jgi:hypothetical protein